jgi:hypothetical protein
MDLALELLSANINAAKGLLTHSSPLPSTYSYISQAIAMPLLEDQRLLHEDLERLEDACADALLEDPPQVGIVTARIA